MARDEYLFNLCHQKKIGILRIYFWIKPTFSIGKSQKIKKVLNVEYVKKKKFAFVRRPTGGKTVFHNDEITYSVVSSDDTFYKNNDLFKSYALICEILVEALNRVGIPAYLSSGNSAKYSRTNHPCFSFTVRHEIEVDKRKIIGSAQKRDKNALLQHGSIPISMDYSIYAQGTFSNPDLVKNRMITLNEIKKVSKEELIESIFFSFESFLDDRLKPYDFTDDEINEIAKIRKKYESKDWNYYC